MRYNRGMLINKQCGSIVINNVEPDKRLGDVPKFRWFQVTHGGGPGGFLCGQVTGLPKDGWIPVQTFDFSVETPIIADSTMSANTVVWELSLVSMNLVFSRKL